MEMVRDNAVALKRENRGGGFYQGSARKGEWKKIGKTTAECWFTFNITQGVDLTWKCYFKQKKASGCFVLATSLSLLFSCYALMLRERPSGTNKGCAHSVKHTQLQLFLSLSQSLSLSASLSLSTSLCTKVSNGWLNLWREHLPELVRRWEKGRVCLMPLEGNNRAPRSSNEEVSIFQFK